MTKDEKYFIMYALNELWYHTIKKLNNRNLGDIEVKNLNDTLDKTKALHKKLGNKWNME